MISYVTGVAAFGENSPLTSDAINTTGVDCLVVQVASLMATPVITDSKSNTWGVPDISEPDVDGETRVSLYVTIPTSVGSGHTFTATALGGLMAMSVLGFAMVDQDTPLDQTSSAANPDSATSIKPGILTPAEAGELFVTGVQHSEDGATGVAVDSGFTLVHSIPYDPDDGHQHLGLFTGYRVNMGTGALDPQWTWSNPVLATSLMATLLPSASPPSTPVDLRVYGLGFGLGLGQMGALPYTPPVSTGYWRPQWRPRRRR